MSRCYKLTTEDRERWVSSLSPQVTLATPMQANDADAETIRVYLKRLMISLWEQEEGFSGKRPFGNSGWKNEIYISLIKSGAAMGTLDNAGCIETCDVETCDMLIFKAIDAL